MTESARDEALRLAREAGFSIVEGVTDYADADLLVHLVELARQRPGWVWVPEEPTYRMLSASYYPDCNAAKRTEIYKAMLAAAPKPEKGT
jgi:hypothetical protein